MSDSDYGMLLVMGALIVVVDGQILYQNGKRYLSASRGVDPTATPMTRLVVVLFHLVALGVLALISTIDIGGTGIQAVVTRLGIVLLIVAIFHAAALWILARIRESREAAALPVVGPRGERERQILYDPVVAPVLGQNGPAPEVSPGIEATGPYETSQ